MTTDSISYSTYMERVHPKLLLIKEWAYPNYRRTFSTSVEEMAEMYDTGNAKTYMDRLTHLNSRFLDPKNAFFIHPPTELLPPIRQVNRVSKEFLVEWTQKERVERWLSKQQKRMAKQKSESNLPSNKRLPYPVRENLPTQKSERTLRVGAFDQKGHVVSTRRSVPNPRTGHVMPAAPKQEKFKLLSKTRTKMLSFRDAKDTDILVAYRPSLDDSAPNFSLAMAA